MAQEIADLPEENDAQSQAALKTYINTIANRVRGMRAQRGMTRKDLSKHSGISERYLAQVETGKANMSIALLWRLAEAMDVGLSEILPYECSACVEHPPLKQFLAGLDADQERRAYQLLQQHFSAPPSGDSETGFQGVALIGLRGAGKTTLGKLLAERTGTPFVRLSDVIEQQGGLELHELFTLFGQKAYRRLERQAIDHILQSYDKVVLEIGGSLVSEKSTYSRLLNSFFTVWVRAKPEEHMSRVMAQGDTRPMEASQKAMDDLKLILAEREPYYMAANEVLDTSGRSVEACAQELISKCRL